MEGMQDAENELMLQDDEEATRIRIGECFFAMTSDDAQESLEKVIFSTFPYASSMFSLFIYCFCNFYSC